MTELDDRPPARTRLSSRRGRLILLTLATVIVVGVAIGLTLFQPWKIFTRNTVNEALPVAAASQVPQQPSQVAAPGPTTPQQTTPPPTAPQPAASGPAASEPTAPPIAAAPGPVAEPAGPMVLAAGSFVDGEHTTTGTASIIGLPDGTRLVRLESFSTSDGPDVHVWLTDQPAGGEDWGKYDDGRYLQLGALKGTDGNQNYPLDAGADLTGLTSVVIWCDRFNVAFGSAPISV